jgi:hypothetical protein
MAKNAVAKKEQAGLPADLANEMAADAGDGQQNVTTEDMAIPFIRILQKMSKQLSKRDGAYIEGASEGDIFNNVTGQIWEGDEGLVVIPCAFNFRVLEWTPLKDGGGLKGSYERGEALPAHTVDEDGNRITAEGTELVDTAENYVLLVADGQVEQAVLSMASSQLKASRKWNSLIGQQQIMTAQGPKPKPRYGTMYRLKTAGASNDSGDWSVWDIGIEGPVEDVNIYRAAKAFSQAVNTGDVQAKHVQEGANDPAEAADDVM